MSRLAELLAKLRASLAQRPVSRLQHIVLRTPDGTGVPHVWVRTEGLAARGMTNEDGHVSLTLTGKRGDPWSVFVDDPPQGYRPVELHEVARFDGFHHQSPDHLVVTLSPVFVEPPQPPRPVRHGIVRAQGKALVDDGGPFLTLGITGFWLGWGVRYDAGRTIENVATIEAAGIDAARVLMEIGEVNDDSWADRRIDPTDQGWANQMHALFGLLAAHGLRAIVAIFGDAKWFATPADRARHVDHCIDILLKYPTAVLYVEIINERGNGDKLPLDECLTYLRRVKQRTPFLVAVSQHEWDDATIAPLHTERKITGDGGVWDHTEQGYDFTGTPNVPGVNQEPIGPHSSVAADSDPTRLAAAASCSYICGAPVYVYHADAGIRGGGAADRHAGRAANYFDVDHFDATTRKLCAVRDFLPPDVSDWGHVAHSNPRHDPDSGGAFPFRTGPLQPHDPGAWFLKAYSCRRGDRWAMVWLGVKRDVPLVAPRAMAFDVLDIVTLETQTVSLVAGEQWTLPARMQAVVLVGRDA